MIEQNSNSLTSNNMRSDKKLLYGMQKLILIIGVLWMTMPIVRNSFISAKIEGLLLIMWLIISILIKPRYLFKNLKAVFIAVWIAELSIYFILGFQNGLNDKLGPFIIFFLCPFVYDYYKCMEDNIFMKKLCIIIIATFFITSLNTIIYILKDPLAARYLSTGKYYIEDKFQNVGNYGLIYSLVLIIPTLFYVYKKYSTKFKILLSITILCFIYTIIKSQFTIALIMLLLIIVLSINPKRSILYSCLIVIGIAIFSKPIGSMLFNISNSVAKQSFDVSVRINEIGTLLSEKILVGDLESRVSIYTISAKTAMNYPLFGKGAIYGYDSYLLGIGGHSEWIDTFARYGFLGSIPILGFFLSEFKNLLKEFKSTSYQSIITSTTLFIFAFGFLNPIVGFPELGVTIFILLPCLLHITTKQHK